MIQNTRAILLPCLKNRLMRFIFLSMILCTILSCDKINPPEQPDPEVTSEETSDLPLDRITLPEGFKISLFAEDVTNARSMDISPSGTVYVGTRGDGRVYALQDTDGDNKSDKMYTLLEDGNMPNGVAFRDGDLYVAEVNRVLKFENIESKLDNPGEPTVVFDKYPTESHHGWKYIAFGPDGKLYIPVGAPCNICDSEDEIFNTITRMNADGSDMEIVQRGVRNTVGFTWHPETNELWFTDNGRDMMGDEIPACELNRASEDGQHFGYPYCHQGDLLDPEFGKRKSCDDYIAPAQNLGPHTAPLGVEFPATTMFPGEYSDRALIAEHGSWNRSKKIGYRISMVPVQENTTATGYDVFASGWLDEEKDEAWGRPVDLEFMDDGSMLISDDFAHVIYRVTYEG